MNSIGILQKPSGTSEMMECLSRRRNPYFMKISRGSFYDEAHASTLSDQGLTAAGSKMAVYRWAMTHELTRKSILAVAEASPGAEAIVVTGAGTRTLKIFSDLESEIRRLVVAADTVLYWIIAKISG